MARIAVGQLRSTRSLTHNLAQCNQLVVKAAAAGAKALFLPEAADYIPLSAKDSIALAQSLSTSPFLLGLQKSARENNIAVNVGVHAPSSSVAVSLQEDGRAQSTKVRNLLLWINSKGEIEKEYQKLHLFDIDIKDGPKLKESDGVEPGSKAGEIVQTGIGNVGMAICFDVRFPETSLHLRRMGADIIVFPSAFTVPTGKAHWRTLMCARAIETQTYVVSAAQVGRHNDKRVSYGHSIVVGPWGGILTELPGIEDPDTASEDDQIEPSIAIADVDLAEVDKIRKSMPLWDMRRT